MTAGVSRPICPLMQLDLYTRTFYHFYLCCNHRRGWDWDWDWDWGSMSAFRMNISQRETIVVW